MSFEGLLTFITSDFFKGNENFLYLSLPLKLMEKIPGLTDIDLNNVIDLKYDFSPVKPFLKIIKANNPARETVREAAYQLQFETFNSYFYEPSIKERNDILVQEEAYFEQTRVKKTIISLFEKCVKGVWIVKNAQELSLEAVDILKSLLKKKFDCKIIFCFDIAKIEQSSDFMVNFVEEISREDNFYEITTFDQEEFLPIEKPFIPSYEVLQESLKCCRMFLSWNQATELSRWIVNNLDSMNFSNSKKRHIYLEMSIISFYVGNFDEASFYLSNVIEGTIVDDEELVIRGMLYMAQVLASKNALSAALKYISLLLTQLENKKDSVYYALTYMLDYRIKERLESEHSLRKYQQALTLLEERGLIGNAINTSLVMPWKLINTEEGRRVLKPKVEAVIEKAREVGDLFALSTAYHWNGILISLMKGSDASLEWFFMCNEIRTEIGELSAIVKVRNGLSHEYLIRSLYEKSYDLLNGFSARIIEMNDYPEIIITLTNIGKAVFFARCFDEAYAIFQKITYLQQIFDLKAGSINSFLMTWNDMTIFKSMIDFIRGENIHTKISLHNIQNNGIEITPAIEPFVDFLWALVELGDKNLDQALDNFDKAYTKFSIQGKISEHCVCFILYEFSIALLKAGYKAESERYFNDGFDFAKEKNLDFFTMGKESASELTIEDYENRKVNLAPLNLNLDVLVEKGEKELLASQLHRRLKNSQFLNRIMTFGSNKLTESNYVNNVAQAVFDFTMAEAVYVVTCEVDGWNLTASISRSEGELLTDAELNHLMQQTSGKDGLKLFYDADRKLIFADISKFDFKGAVIIVPSQNAVIDSEDFNVLEVALSNLQAHIVMLKQNEHLMFISSTDQLSMLKNRRALQEQMNIQSEMIKRYNSRKDGFFQTSVVFIDLDNFKFYNDNYGHESGDLLISKFGELLRRVFRKVDFIARFGGDEFVVLMPNTNCREAARGAARLHKVLEDADFFIPDLIKLLGKKITIPENRHIGFSTGICSNYDIEDQKNMEEVMARADQALYYVKETGKGAVAIWPEVKDKIHNEDVSEISSDTLEIPENKV